MQHSASSEDRFVTRARPALCTEALSSRSGSFFVGGHWSTQGESVVRVGQMYTSYRLPPNSTASRVVFVPGGGLNGSVWEETPDRRPGWAPLFAARGYSVFVVDQPGRGRSGYHPATDGDLTYLDAKWVEENFTNPARIGRWPQARLHSQWPGAGRRGDPIFDAFCSSLVGFSTDRARNEAKLGYAAVDLLDEIGPSVLVTHSQSSAFGWLAADRRPDSVRAIVAVEPGGPPFRARGYRSGHYGLVERPYGITTTPIRSDAPPGGCASGSATPLVADRGPRAHLQTEPARSLVNIARVPVLVVTGEASENAEYDALTVEFLRQAGVTVTHLRLAETAIHGNGHLLMIERNNEHIASAIDEWLLQLPTHAPAAGRATGVSGR